MVDCFIARGVRKDEEPDEFLLVTTASIGLDDVWANRFRRAANLAPFLVFFEAGQFIQRHAMHINRCLARQLPNLKIAVAHGRGARCEIADARCRIYLASRSPHRVSRQNSSSSRAGARSRRRDCWSESRDTR